jgi:predicted metal-dependent hydrolase
MLHLPRRFYDALALLQDGEYFECHEVLEELWREEPTSLRLFYQGILQVAVGCYHLTVRHNRRGGLNKLREGLAKLQQFPAVMGLLDVRDLREQVQALLERVQQMSDEEIASWHAQALLSVRYLG